MKVNLYIPTLNAGDKWPAVVNSIRSQSLDFNKKIIIDSGSTDSTLNENLTAGFEIIKIDKRTFDHGGTRQLAVDRYPDADVYVFMTQDAILANPQAVATLVDEFARDPSVGIAYGRQLPHRGAKPLEAHARLFNYPAQSQHRDLSDAPKYKIKTISCSNSFAAYRSTALKQVGGFPSNSILGEDVIVAGKMLLEEWSLAYVADAQAHHSHDYTVAQEFKRYFDIGVFHKNNVWIFDKFGRAESEGVKYLKSEFHYVLKNNALAFPKAAMSIVAKWLGYKMGLHYEQFPADWSKRFSMHKHFWKQAS